MEILKPGTSVMVVTEGANYGTGVVGIIADDERTSDSYPVMVHDNSEADWYAPEDLVAVEAGTPSYSTVYHDGTDGDIDKIDWDKVEAVRLY